MATADEILASVVETNSELIIDGSLRTIIIPKDITNIGVESDDDVLKLRFRMPRYYHGIDLSLFNKRINYINANEEADIYKIEDASVSGNDITFSWTVGRHAVAYKGNVIFSVCLREIDANSIVTKEFNTTPTRLPVLEGLEVEEGLFEDHAVLDILDQWERQFLSAGDSTMANIAKYAEEKEQEVRNTGSAVLATIPDDYTTISNKANEAIRTRANAIMPTFTGEAVVVDDASGDYLRDLHLYGYSTQDGTPTPSDPIEIVNASSDGSTVVSVTGKNIFNVNNEAYSTLNATRSVENNALTITTNDINSLARVTYKLDYALNQPYRLSFDATMLEGVDVYSVPTVRLRKGNASCGIIMLNNTATKTHYEVDIPPITESGYEIWFYLKTQNTAGVISVKFENIQIELGSASTPYSPYVEPQTLTYVNPDGLPGIKVTKDETYIDAYGQKWVCDEVDYGRGVYIQRIGKVAIDGVSHVISTAAHTSNGQRYCTVNPENIAYNSTMMSDRYSWPVAGWTNENNGIYCMNRTVVITDSRFTSNEVAIDILGTEKPVLMYVLAEPVETPLTDGELYEFSQLRTNYPDTAISNDSSMCMKVSYNADTQLYFNNSRGATDEQVQAAVNAYLDAHFAAAEGVGF